MKNEGREIITTVEQLHNNGKVLQHLGHYHNFNT